MRLKKARSRLICTAKNNALTMAVPNGPVDKAGPSAAMSDGNATRTTAAARHACSRLLIGPAAAMTMKSRRGSRRLFMLTGTGLAQPISGSPLMAEITGSSTVPIQSMWTSGFSETRPSIRAVGSPSLSAVQACAASWMVSEIRSTPKPMAAARGSIFNEEPQEYARTRVLSRLCAARFLLQQAPCPPQIAPLVGVERRELQVQAVEGVDHGGGHHRAGELLVVGRNHHPGRVRRRGVADRFLVGRHVGAPPRTFAQIAHR